MPKNFFIKTTSLFIFVGFICLSNCKKEQADQNPTIAANNIASDELSKIQKQLKECSTQMTELDNLRKQVTQLKEERDKFQTLASQNLEALNKCKTQADKAATTETPSNSDTTTQPGSGSGSSGNKETNQGSSSGTTSGSMPSGTGTTSETP